MYRVIRAERDDPPIRSSIMDTASLYSLKVHIIKVHKMHSAYKERMAMEFFDRISSPLSENIDKQFFYVYGFFWGYVLW